MGIRTNGNSAFFRVFFGCYLFAYKWEFEQMGSKFQYFAWKKRNSRIMKNNKHLKFENLQLSKKRNQTVSLFPWCQLEVFLHEGNSWNWNIAEIWSFEVKLQFRFPKKREISSLEETKFETGILCFCCFWTKNRWVLLQQTRFLCFWKVDNFATNVQKIVPVWKNALFLSVLLAIYSRSNANSNKWEVFLDFVTTRTQNGISFVREHTALSPVKNGVPKGKSPIFQTFFTWGTHSIKTLIYVA